MPPRRLRVAPLALALLAALVACGGGAPLTLPKPYSPPPALPQVDDLELRALLLLLADRQLYEPLTVERAFAGDAELRRELAVTLGRLDDRAAIRTLQGLLLDQAPEVRRAAAFALDRPGAEVARPQLLRVAVGEDREAARRAVAALAASGTALLDVGEKLAELGGEETWHRLLPALHRFPDAARAALAKLGWSEAPTPELRAWAAYALAREPLPESAPTLRELLLDPDPWTRGVAARALGRVGEAADLERLLPLLGDADEGPVIHALEAGRRLVASARAAPAASWSEPLAALLSDPRPGVRAAAIDAAARWLLDPVLEPPLLAAAEAPGWAGDAALVALARGGHRRASDLAQRAAGSSEPSRRAAAARAAALLGSREVLDELQDDPLPRVRLAVLEARWHELERAGWNDSALDRGAELARAALADPDPALAAVGFDRLTRAPLLPVAELAPALGRRSRLVEATLAGVRALAARAETADAERADALELLSALALDRRWLVRRQAAAALARLGAPATRPGAVETGKGVAAYEDVVLRTRAPRRLEMLTARGRLVLELDCPAAPLTCLSFVQLAEQGFFDGQRISSVAPGFAVQAGDPRGDGWGGPGYRLRDEVNPRRFVRGTLGMALSGPDTAGSQFFVTLAPQPHLDGVYTAFGRVAEGDELLDLLEPGDLVETIRPL